MTIPGVDALSHSHWCGGGDFGRFRTPEQLVSYLGLNARVKQPAQGCQSRADHQERASARARTLVEAALTASKTPGRCERSTTCPR